MLSGLINTNERTLISVEQIKADGGTQMRAGLDDATVTEYADFFRESRQWGDFPPVVLYHDGADYWLADGFHRVAAWKRAGNALMGAKIPADVRSGTRRDAILYAAGANANHGLRRTNADKRRSVEVLLRDEEWSKWSDAEIARRCEVSQPFVSNVRKQMAATYNDYKSPTERVGADGRTINTANIGASRRYESGLPALNVPSPRPTIGAQPKMPITDWELSDICETVANEMFGDITRSRVVALTRIMVTDANTKTGGYWDKLLRTLAPFDAPVSRIQAAVADAAQRMVAERGATLTEPEASAPAPAAKPPMTPEAKELSREIKAATWGDKPYAEVWEIQSALGGWQHTLNATGLRNLARFRGGADWFDCRVALGEMRYRDRDLVQALNNLASVMEQRAASERGREGEGETVDPWVAVWMDGRGRGTREEGDRALAALAVAMQEWVLAWTDDKGRTWRDVADRSPYHANSPFRQDLHAECRRRGLLLHGEVLGSVIVEIFSNLAAAEAPVVAAEVPEADEDVPATVEMPDDLVDVWSPRFEGAGVYLVDVVRNRSTETVALDDIAELFAQARRMDGALGAEEETLTAADLQVMQMMTEAMTQGGEYDTGMAAPATALPDKGYAMQSDVEGWLEQVAATPAELREAAETRHGRVWEKLVRMAAAAGYALSEATPRVALQNMANQREYEQRKAQALRGAPVVPLTPPIEPPIAVPLKPAPDDRVGKMARLIAGYQATITTFDEYGELIGAHLETLPAKRELEKLIKHLRREIDLLEGKVIEEAWG